MPPFAVVTQLPASVASQWRLERLLQLPSRRVGPDRSFHSKALTSNSFHSVMDRLRLTILHPCVTQEVNPRFHSRVVIRAGGGKKLAMDL